MTKTFKETEMNLPISTEGLLMLGGLQVLRNRLKQERHRPTVRHTVTKRQIYDRTTQQIITLTTETVSEVTKL